MGGVVKCIKCQSLCNRKKVERIQDTLVTKDTGVLLSTFADIYYTL